MVHSMLRFGPNVFMYPSRVRKTKALVQIAKHYRWAQLRLILHSKWTSEMTLEKNIPKCSSEATAGHVEYHVIPPLCLLS